MHALAWSLVHVWWQAALVWALRVAVDGLFPERATGWRYGATTAALATVVGAWLGTWAWLASMTTLGGVGGSPTWATWGLALWCAGVVLLGSRVVGGLWSLHRLAVTATPVDAVWQARLNDLAQVAGVQRAVRLLSSARVDGPMVVGWLRPVILMPPAVLLHMSREHVEAVLLHELAHVRRHDWLVGIAIAAVETLLFHVPFVWLLARRARNEREECCDEAAARWHGDRLDLARALLALEEQRPSRLAVAARGGSLMSRIEHLVRPEGRHAPLRSMLQLVLLGGLCVGTWACSVALVPTSEAAPTWLPERVERWVPMIEEVATTHGIDPDLLAIVVLIESRGNADATSPVGARGLTQVMPATARRIAEARGIDAPTSPEMADPKLNLDFGAWYLARQLDTFGKGLDEETAVSRVLAAYNGGPDAARRWIETGEGLSAETTRYVEMGMSLWRERDRASSPTLDRMLGR